MHNSVPFLYRVICSERVNGKMSLQRRQGRVRLVWAAGLLLAALSPMPGFAQGQPGTFGLEDLSGAELYQRFCASCHGESGRGDGPVARTLVAAVPDLTQIRRRYNDIFPSEELRAIVDGRNLVTAHGTRAMPVWGYEFWWEEGADVEAEAAARNMIDRLLTYLRSIQSDF